MSIFSKYFMRTSFFVSRSMRQDYRNIGTTPFSRIKSEGRFTAVALAGTLGSLTFAAWGLSKYSRKDADCEGVHSTEPLFQDAINKCQDLIKRKKDEYGCPGIVIGVSIDGEQIWSQGFGYSDVENRVDCKPETVMRIASISKPLTMVAVARLIEAGKLDLNKPIQFYLPEFPEKTYKDKKVEMTVFQLACHLSGIRHYEKDPSKVKKVPVENSSLCQEENELKPSKEFSNEEYYIKKYFPKVEDAVDLFKDDVLVAQPGAELVYTTHGYTVLSRVIEKVSKKPFPEVMREVFKDMGMQNTYLDFNSPLIYHRSRNYIKDNKGKLVNGPYVDNSYKWAGGGFLSTVSDLMKFGNAMLYSQQYQYSTNTLPGYLQSKTVDLLWKPVAKLSLKTNNLFYGLGWEVVPYKKQYGACWEEQFYVSHSGAAVGASSVLSIFPSMIGGTDKQVGSPPKGIVVAIMTNMINVSLSTLAYDVANIFEGATSKTTD